MKEGILIELLKKVSPDTEVMCRITTDDLAQLTNMTVWTLRLSKNTRHLF